MTAVLKANQNVLLRCALLHLTTVALLARGVQEANPLVKWSMAALHGHLSGLLLVKCLACVLAISAVQSGRTRVVARMNRFFTFLVGWNLFALATTFTAQ